MPLLFGCVLGRHVIARERQTYFRSSLLSPRKITVIFILIFRRERSDYRKYVCGSQARRVRVKTNAGEIQARENVIGLREEKG